MAPKPRLLDRPSQNGAPGSRALDALAERASAYAAGRENGDGQGETAATISRAIVGLLRTRTGRGPTRARTALSSDLAIVTLGDFRTAAERTLAAEGQRALATQFRAALHDGMRAEAVAAVEAITGREVAAYLTAQQHDPDLAVIAFHFGPSARLQEPG
jgi:uncharacterized protein YbcI